MRVAESKSIRPDLKLKTLLIGVAIAVVTCVFIRFDGCTRVLACACGVLHGFASGDFVSLVGGCECMLVCLAVCARVSFSVSWLR